jgi:hypothetical protein
MRNIVFFRKRRVSVLNLISAFKTRVSDNSGLSEAETCLNILLTNLNKIQ